jgi:hypothetical protein
MDSEYTSKEPSGWWKWPLLPFASIIGAMIGAMLLTLLQWFGMKMQGGFSEDGWYFLYVLPVISSIAFGWLFVLITLNVAPRGKVIAAIVMTTILGVIIVFSLIFIWLNPVEGIGSAIQSTVGSIATMISAIVSIVNYREEYSS